MVTAFISMVVSLTQISQVCLTIAMVVEVEVAVEAVEVVVVAIDMMNVVCKMLQFLHWSFRTFESVELYPLISRQLQGWPHLQRDMKYSGL
jgi:hypothetical protein